MKKYFLAGIAAILGGLVGGAFLVGEASAQVASIPLCTETDAGGCVMQLPVGGTIITVASDGEAPFDPFSSGLDTSDGIQFDSLWLPVQTTGWVQIPGTNTWIVPGCDSAGVCENGPVNEPIGQWDAPGNVWSSAANFLIYESDGRTVSDVISIFNDANGTANITFSSIESVPEPSTWALMLFGFAGLAFAGYRRAKVGSVAPAT
jgi:hypothetical protein